MVLNELTYLSAADDKHLLIADLPGEDQRASALNCWKLVRHSCQINRFLT
jgi:hypothetical protein